MKQIVAKNDLQILFMFASDGAGKHEPSEVWSYDASCQADLWAAVETPKASPVRAGFRQSLTGRGASVGCGRC